MSEPLFEPGNSGFGTFDGVSIRLGRTRNHHDRDAKPARGFDLGVGRRAAGVFRDEKIDFLALKKRRFRLPVEGPASEQQPDIGRQRDIARRVDRAGDVVMMRRGCEGAQLEAAKREKNAARVRPERVGSGFGVRDGKPGVAGLGLPGRAYDRGKRDRKPGAGDDRVGRDLVGVGVRGVNDRSRCIQLQPVNQAVHAAEAADPRSNGLRLGIRGAPGQRDSCLEARVRRQQARQLRGLRGTSEDENAHRDHLHEY
jgi:hypothetical protein